jgi:DNA-nicking Smr family endonuclease
MAGVRNLGARKDAPPPRATAMKLPPAPVAPAVRESDRAARAQLAALVSGGLHFEIRREDDWQAGLRKDAPRGTLESLASATPGGDAALDLHGARAADVEARVAKFVSQLHRRGVRRLRIVHGKGLHSDAGGPVLGDAVIDALTKGAAAARVLAFVTAPESQGGAGALLVELAR